MAPSSKTDDEVDSKIAIGEVGQLNTWTETATVTATQTLGGEPNAYVQDLQYFAEEESQVVRILDTRLFPWILLTTFVLNMDRTNNSNAISDNLPGDLGFTIDTVNTATAIYAVFFSIFCFSGAVMAKIVGPARWIPILMFAWGLVTMSHALIKDRGGYITVRIFIAITEGGVIPATLIYLGGFYKSTELPTRLGWFWGIQAIASAVSGLMASGLLQLGGRSGLEGWKWLFLVDGIITVCVAVVLSTAKRFFHPRRTKGHQAVVYGPPGPNRYYAYLGLWGHLLLSNLGLTPTNPLGTYLPTVIKSFNFNVFVSNALTAPPYVLQCIFMIILTRHSDMVRERGFHGAFGSAWQLVGWIILRAMPEGASRGVKYFGAIVVASWPQNHPLNIGWMSEKTGSVGKRSIASGASRNENREGRRHPVGADAVVLLIGVAVVADNATQEDDDAQIHSRFDSTTGVSSGLASSVFSETYAGAYPAGGVSLAAAVWGVRDKDDGDEAEGMYTQISADIPSKLFARHGAGHSTRRAQMIVFVIQSERESRSELDRSAQCYSRRAPEKRLARLRGAAPPIRSTPASSAPPLFDKGAEKKEDGTRATGHTSALAPTL
ncbi:MFS general substrate transporter [Mycena sanguinolenta]|uniref:MFS general substrate transporter n=1 Tax=Mycena sanguinolenta TaxID=230812 RepID=A0A8H6X6Q4_9AGAR|nr:MFS general substrate transporter [Mycena sanguinolenta]